MSAAEPRRHVTVAVVTRNQSHLLAECLRAIDRQTYADTDVVVIDNGSTDPTAAVVEAHATTSRLPVRLVRHEGAIGSARQRAVEEAGGDLLAFTDTDCRPDPGWIGAAVRHFDNAAVDVVQGRTVPAGPTHRWCATQDIDRFTDLYETCNIVYRTAALRRAGGFDPDWGFLGEDTVAGWRVRRLGGAARYEPDSLVRHEVFAGGLRWHLHRASGYGTFNALARRFPEMRRELFWHRYFLRRRSAEFDALSVGIALAATARRHPVRLLFAMALSLPWLRRHRPSQAGGAVATLEMLAFEATAAASLVRGSIRERTVVL